SALAFGPMGCDHPRASPGGDAAPSASGAWSVSNAAVTASGSALGGGRSRTKVTVEAAAMGTHLLFVALTTDALDEPGVRATLDRAVAEVRRLEGLMT